MNVIQYLERILYVGDIEPTYDALKRLQKSHVLTIPFENLDIQYGKPIDLDIWALFDKIVERKRGGFCFELNGLFCELLREIGFNAHLISARVFSKETGFGAPFDHAAICVKFEQRNYLVDVGFGEFAFEPLLIGSNETQQDERGRFLIEKQEDGDYLVSKVEHGKKKMEYIFELSEYELNDFEGMCLYHQTSPLSPFTQRKLITIPFLNGRFTLTSDKFIHKIASRLKIETILSEVHFQTKLEAIFGYNVAELSIADFRRIEFN